MTSGTGFTGNLSPADAMETLVGDKGAVLVDVRTKVEWEQVGVPDLAAVGVQPVFLEWLTYSAMAPNPTFTQELSAELERRGATKDTPLLFLCRSGARSAAAATAMTALGHTETFNVVGGFEGSPGQSAPGWKDHGLPWKRP